MAARMVLWLAASCWYKWFLNLLRSQYIRVYQDYNHRSPSYHKCQHDKIDLECVSSRCSMSHGTVMWPLVFMLSNFYKHVDTFWCFCSRIVFNGCSFRYEGASLAFLSFFFMQKRIYKNKWDLGFLSFGELHDHYSNSFPTELRYIPMSRNGGIETQLFPIPSAFPALHICDALNICLCYADSVQYSP